MQTSAEDPKITFASCLSLKCRRKGTKKAKEDRRFVASVRWRPCAGVRAPASVRWRTAAIERTTCDLSCPSAIRDNLLICLWPSRESHDTAVKAQGKATRTAWKSTISSGQLWLIGILHRLQLLIVRECFWGEAEREWWEAEVTSALHCFVGHKTSFCEVTPMKKWTK